MCGCTRLPPLPLSAGMIQLLTAIAAENECNCARVARRHFTTTGIGRRRRRHCCTDEIRRCGPIDRAHCTLHGDPQKLRTHNSRCPDALVRMQRNGRGLLAGARCTRTQRQRGATPPGQSKIAACWPIIQVWALCCPCILHVHLHFGAAQRRSTVGRGIRQTAAVQLLRRAGGNLSLLAATRPTGQSAQPPSSRGIASCRPWPPLRIAAAAAATAGASLAAQLNQCLRRVAHRCYVNMRLACQPALQSAFLVHPLGTQHAAFRKCPQATPAWPCHTTAAAGAIQKRSYRPKAHCPQLTLTTPGSARVEISPSSLSWPEAILRSTAIKAVPKAAAQQCMRHSGRCITIAACCHGPSALRSAAKAAISCGMSASKRRGSQCSAAQQAAHRGA